MKRGLLRVRSAKRLEDDIQAEAQTEAEAEEIIGVNSLSTNSARAGSRVLKS